MSVVDHENDEEKSPSSSTKIKTALRH